MHRVFSRIMELDIPEMVDMKPTVSVGAILLPEGTEVQFDDVYRKTDECVYRSKNVEGNNITFCELNPEGDKEVP